VTAGARKSRAEIYGQSLVAPCHNCGH